MQAQVQDQRGADVGDGFRLLGAADGFHDAEVAGGEEDLLPLAS